MSAKQNKKDSYEIYQVLADIAFDIVNDVEGVVGVKEKKGLISKKKITVVPLNNGKINIDIKVKVQDTYSIPEVAVQIQESVKNAIEKNTKFEVCKINVHVVSAIVLG